MSSTLPPLQAQIQQAREQAVKDLVTTNERRRQVRSDLYPNPTLRQPTIKAADLAFYASVRQIHDHRPRLLSVPEMAAILNVSRARVYQILEYTAPPPPDLQPAQTQLPETDL